MNQPMIAATIATMVPARYALTMKWNSRSRRTSSTTFQLRPGSATAITSVVDVHATTRVEVRVVAGGFGLADHDETTVGGAQHLDRGAIERGERLATDHVRRHTHDCTPLGEVDDPIEVR